MKLRLSWSCAAICLALYVTPASADVNLEYKVKAAFLLNFVKFVEWPTQSTDKKELCVVGKNPFDDFLDDLLHSQPIGVSARYLGSMDEVPTSCIILYSQSGEFGQVKRDAAVLTVSDSDSKTSGIVFKIVENKVRFKVASEVLAERGLRASSKLQALSVK